MPDPLGPMIATRSPGSTSRSRPSRIGPRPSYPNATDRSRSEAPAFLLVAIRLAVPALEREVHQVAELLDGGHQVVPALEVLAELGEGADDRHHDQLGGHELPEGQLPLDDEPPPQPQQRRRGDRLKRQPEDHLAEDDPEVVPAHRR